MLTTDSPTVELDKTQTGWILSGFFSYLAAYSEDTGNLALEVDSEDNALVFTLSQMGIAKKGFDKITMEMFAFICNAYIELQVGEIRKSELGETEALVQFTLPK